MRNDFTCTDFESAEYHMDVGAAELKCVQMGVSLWSTKQLVSELRILLSVSHSDDDV